MTVLVIVVLAFVGLTAITFSTQNAQAATTPLCPSSNNDTAPVTATVVTYGGKKFDIIGYNKGGTQVGVAGPNNSVTLLYDKTEPYIPSMWDDPMANIYSGSIIETAMNNFANSTLNDNVGIIPRTLFGGSDSQGTSGYLEDNIAGSDVFNQKAWPLSIDEASHVIMSSRNYTIPNSWWTRSPGYRWDMAAYIGPTAVIQVSGTAANSNQNIRPALYLNISNSAFTGINFDNNNLPIGACTREPTNLGIDYSAETVTGLDTATEGWKIGPTYGGLGAFTPQASTSTDIDGIITNTTQALVFVKAKDDDDHFDSDKDRNGVAQQSLATTINIPARPNGPSVTGVAPSDVGKSDGKITGTNNKMEYSTDEATWTNVTGAAITGLTSGTYFVRTIADQSAKKFKSFAKEVIVKEGSAGPSAGPGSGAGPSAGDDGDSNGGTAQTGIDFTGLGLLLAMMLVGAVVLRRPVTGIMQPEIATLRSQ
jgi:hypothetical protein